MKEVRGWNTNDAGLHEIFCAAITGICANPSFFGPLFQQHPDAAVEFADQVVLSALYHPALALQIKPKDGT